MSTTQDELERQCLRRLVPNSVVAQACAGIIEHEREELGDMLVEQELSDADAILLAVVAMHSAHLKSLKYVRLPVPVTVGLH